MKIAMGIINLLAVQDYWSSGLSQVSWFSAIMLVGQICQCLHFADNKKTPDRNSKEFKLYIITTAHQEHLCLWNHTHESKCLS